MKLSTRARYGIHAMYDLACNDGAQPRPLKAVAEAQGIPEAYLEQLLCALRRGGLVQSVRGAQGGYQIAAAPETVSLRDIIDAVEGPIELSECASADNACHRSGTCPVRWVWQRVTDSINTELEKIKLSDMLTQACESEEEQP